MFLLRDGELTDYQVGQLSRCIENIESYRRRRRERNADVISPAKCAAVVRSAGAMTSADAVMIVAVAHVKGAVVKFGRLRVWVNDLVFLARWNGYGGMGTASVNGHR
ncbi:hypothetical protein PHISP_02078 [Aspergillus sp. HF37]|nr:hypothetical protein PHISP_02078 [Aspergillus sp. HF37]